MELVREWEISVSVVVMVTLAQPIICGDELTK